MSFLECLALVVYGGTLFVLLVLMVAALVVGPLGLLSSKASDRVKGIGMLVWLGLLVFAFAGAFYIRDNHPAWTDPERFVHQFFVPPTAEKP
jgi:hypothetical protein